MRRRTFLAGAATAGLAGCLGAIRGRNEAAWSQFQRDGGHTGFVEGVNGPETGGRVRWRSDTWGFQTGPVIAGDTVYLGCGLRTKQVVAVDATTGDRSWDVPVEGDIERFLAVANGSVLAVVDRPFASEAEIHAFDAATGEERWAKGTESVRRPVVVDGNVVTSLDGDRMAAIDAATGEEQWRGDPDTDGSPAVYEDQVVVARADRVFALDVATGEPEWSTSFAAGNGSPTVGDGTIFLATSEGVHAIDASNGEELWSLAGYFGATEPAVAGETLYLTGWREDPDSPRAFAVDIESGDVDWTYGLELVTGGSVVVGDDVVYVAGGNRLYALEATSGEPAFWLRFQWPVGPPAIGDETLFLGVGGRLHAIRDGEGRRGDWRIDEEPSIENDAASPTPEYDGSDLYFGLDGYDVVSETSVTLPEDAPIDASLTVDGDRIDRSEELAVEFAVTNRSERTLTFGRPPPGPFGVWALRSDERSLTLWTDAYGDSRHVHVRPGDVPSVDAVPGETEIPPGGTVRETFTLSDETHGIRPGTYEFSRPFRLSPEDGDGDGEAWEVEPRVTVALEPAGPEDGDVAYDLVVPGQVESPEAFTGEFEVDVLEPMTDAHPGLIEITYRNSADVAAFVRTLRDPPLGAFVGVGPAGRRLVLVGEDVYAPGLVERTADGWWQTNFLPHEWNLHVGGRTQFGAGETATGRFVVTTHPETDPPTPGDEFVFEQGYDDGDVDFTWGFSLSPREPG